MSGLTSINLLAAQQLRFCALARPAVANTMDCVVKKRMFILVGHENY